MIRVGGLPIAIGRFEPSTFHILKKTSLFIFINDSFEAEENASLLVSDLSIQRGYGVFDFFRTINNKPVHLDDHLDRFFFSASKMRLPIGKTREQLKEIISELMQKNNIPDSGIRITLTGGYSSDGYSVSKPNLIISQKPLIINDDVVNTIKLVSYAHQRQLPDVKSIDYMMAIWLKPFVEQNSADDLLYHTGGSVTESPRSNFFIVTADDKIVTPSNNILKGINRKYVTAIANKHFAFEERDITLDEAYNAKEAFLTSTTKLVLPVVKIDDKTIGNGEAGKFSLFIRQLLKELISQD